MAHDRSWRALLAVAVLTTGLLGCTNLNGHFTLPDGTTANDGLKPGGDLQNPGDQLLSNSAATAITDVVATLRDVGALKHMASQQPLLSNSGSTLLSNGMSGYRIASLGLSHEDYNRIIWNDSGDWPDAATLEEPVTFEGVIKGSVDGKEVEHYTYTVTMGPGSYSRQETVVASSFRKTGLYEVTGNVVDYSPAEGRFSYYVVEGSSTYDPQGVNRKVNYVLNTIIDDTFSPWDVTTSVKGVLPTGTNVDLVMDYVKDYAHETGTDMLHSLTGGGTMTLGGKTVKYKTAAEVVDNGGITGQMQLGLASNSWLRFDFTGGQALQGTYRNDAGENLGPLELTSDQTKVILKHPGEDKPEHLDLTVLPGLYRLGLEATLPPF